MVTELLLVRHGQIGKKSRESAASGEFDPPLSGVGRESARKIAKRLSLEKDLFTLYSSPLRRARETADIISSQVGLEPKVVEALREWSMPRDVGVVDWLRLMIVSAVSHIAPIQFLLRYQWANSPSLLAYLKGISEAISEIVTTNQGKRVIVVAHGGAIDALLTHYFPGPDRWKRGVIRNCSLTRLQIDKDEARLLMFNDYSHLG